MTWRWRALAFVALVLASSAWSLRDSERALAGPCDTDIVFGEEITCNVTSPTQIRDLTFSGNDNDRVRVRVFPVSGAVNPLTSIRFGGGQVCAQTFADEFTCELTSTGVQTLRVDANGSGTGSFVTTIERLNNPSACPAVALSPTGTTGAINQNAEIDCFARANGVAGQRFQVRVVETSGAATLLFEVVRPDGSTVCGPTGSVEASCLLDAAGTHRILVYANGGLTTANYRIVVERFPGPTGCTATAFGAPSSVVTINNPGEISCHTFNATTGDRIRARVIPTSGALNPLTEILRPDGSTVCAQTFADDQTCAVDANGLYTMIVREGAGNGEATGTAALRIERLNNPSACPAVALSPTGTTGAINQNAEIDCFARANGVAGQRFQVRVVETSGAATLLFEVVRPDGSTVCGPTGSVEASCLLDAAGTHRILVYANGGLTTANYRIVVERFPGPTGCTATAFGAPSSVVTINNPGEISCHTFNATTGDRIRARVIPTSGALNPLTEILRPDGSTVCAQTFADDQTCAVDANGLYTMIVREGAGNGDATGTAALRIERLNNPSACPAVALSPTGTTGAINQNAEIDCFARANGVAGQRFQVRVVETSGAATLLFEVVRPDGSTVCGPTGSVEASCLLDAAGTHRILVYANGGLTTANYRIVVERFPSPTGCTATAFGAPSSVVTINNPGEISCHTFNATTGDRIRARVIPTSGALNPLTEILRPDGSTVCAQTFADDQTCAVDANGLYTMIVREGAGNGDATGTAALRIERLNNPSACPAVALSPTGTTGAINQNAEIDCFARANGVAGQRFQVRVVETSGAATLLFEVVRPDGSTVCGPTGSVEASCLLDAAGTHRILVYANGGLTTANYRIVVERFPSPTGCTATAFGAPSSVVTINNPGEISCHTFNATTGDRIRARVIPTSGALNPLTEILRPDGSTVCAQTFADDQTCAVDANGLYTMIVREGAGNGDATGTAALRIERLNNPSACPAVALSPTGTTGAINQNAEIDCFARANGVAGQRFQVRVVETSGAATLLFEVVRPDGSTVCGPTGSVEASCLLDAAGTHRILVYANGGLTTANYRIVVERFPGPTGCTAKTIGDPAQVRTIDDPGEIDCITFAGTASQDVRVRALASGGALNPLTEVLRPDGTTVCAQTFADDFVCDLDVNGTYTVIVREGAGNGDATGTYSLQLLDPP